MGFPKSRCAGCVTGQELLGREEYVHFQWRRSTEGKYCAVLHADGTP